LSSLEDITKCPTDSLQAPSLEVFPVTDALHYRFPIKRRSDSNGLWHTYGWGFV